MWIEIRSELPCDKADVYRINSHAFGRDAEARLVDALRDVRAIHLSVVAVVDGSVVGHILFTPMRFEPPAADASILGLGPLAVLPSHQKQGVGSLLVREGLARCRADGIDMVFVLGDPKYYSRFGFTLAKPAGITCEFDAPRHFMQQKLGEKTLGEIPRKALYHPLFQTV